MKMRLFALAVLASAALVVGGCASTQKTDGEGATVTDGSGTAGARSGKWSSGSLDDPSSPLSQRVLYFEFDSSELRSDSVGILRAHGEYLAANRNTTITVEGHCDERGSREYNLALGERRANSVKRFLEAQGVSGRQVSIISYGEERPAARGNDEQAWAENRRAVLVY